MPSLVLTEWTSLVAQTVKCLPTVQETQVQFLGQEDLLEKEMTTHSSILAWRIPWTEKPGRLQSMGSQRAGHDWVISPTPSPGSYNSSGWPLETFLRLPEGGTTAQDWGFLENPRDRETWQATVQIVTKSWTQLSDFTSLHFKEGYMKESDWGWAGHEGYCWGSHVWPPGCNLKP